jgi:hypothetical protein
MATDCQIEANRCNARKSTGPRTEEGKAASRRNACKHGLAGSGVVVAEAEVEAIKRRAAEWAAVIRPVNTVEAFYAVQCATESVRVERCQAEERVLIARSADRAADPIGWDEDRRLEAEELGARLARGPSRTIRRLRQTIQGCEWLLDRWLGLGQVLQAGQPWDDAQRSLALDLLGIPRELRSGRTLADPGPGDGLDTLAPQRDLVARTVAELEELRSEVLVDRDIVDREIAEVASSAGEGASGGGLTRVRRYESACQRRLDRALRLLLSGRFVVCNTPEAGSVADPVSCPSRMEPVASEAPHSPAPPHPVAVGDPVVSPPAAEVPRPAGPQSAESPALNPTPPTLPATDQPRGNRRWRKAQVQHARPKAA